GVHGGHGLGAGPRRSGLLARRPVWGKAHVVPAPPLQFTPSATAPPQVKTITPGSSNQMVMTITSTPPKSPTLATQTPNTTATGTTAAPLLLKPNIATTNK